jgi:hypothetical protein
MKLRLALFSCLALLGLGPFLPAPAGAQSINVWINPADGAWGSAANWSAGAPSVTQSLLLITNANTKTITLGGPHAPSGFKTISNLVVSAPAGSTNTLQMDTVGAGTNLFEVLNGLAVNSGGEWLFASTITGRVNGVSGGGLDVDGRVRVLSGQLVTSNTYAHIGVSGQGSMTVEDADWYAKEVALGYLLGGYGTLAQTNASIVLSGELRMAPANSSTGIAYVTDGLLSVTNANAYVGLYANGVGIMNLNNSLWRGRDVYVGYYGASQGTLDIKGGTNAFLNGLTIADSVGANGRVTLVCSQLLTTNAAGTGKTVVGGSGTGTLTTTSNLWRTQDAFIGRYNSSSGYVDLHYSTNFVTGSMVIGDSAGSTGSVDATGGSLFVTNTAGNARLEVGRNGHGSFHVQGTFVVADRLLATNPTTGSISLDGGNLTTRNTQINGLTLYAGDWQMPGGSHQVGSVQANNGTVTVRDAQLSGSFDVGPMGAASMLVSNVTWNGGDIMVGTMGSGHDYLSLLNSTCTLGNVLVGGDAYGNNLLAVGGTLNLHTLDVGIEGLGEGIAAFSNTVWRAETVRLGMYSHGSPKGSLILSGSSGVITNELLIATNTASSGATLSLFGGELAVTNAAGTARVHVGNSMVVALGLGLLQVQGGTLQTDQLVISNSVSESLHQVGAIDFKSGTLNTRNALMVDSRNLSLGGSNCPPATWVMHDGLHLFKAQLVPNWSHVTPLRLGPEPASTGAIYLASGTLITTNVPVFVGDAGIGLMTISNGTWQAGTVLAGCSNGAAGTLGIHGGSVSISTNLTLGHSGCGATGTALMTGGRLSVTNVNHDATLEVRSGAFTLSNGVVTADCIIVTNECARFIRYGGTLQAGQVVLDPNFSANGDGIPNSWKQLYGLDPFLWNVGSLDPDGDGMSNLREYMAGTNPTNAASVLRILSVRRVGSDVEVVCQGAGIRTLYLQAASGLTNGVAGAFQDSGITNRLRQMRDYVITNLDIGGATQSIRFYRLREGL